MMRTLGLALFVVSVIWNTSVFLNGQPRRSKTAWGDPDVTIDLRPEEIQPWAAALTKQRRQSPAKDDPANMQCRPQGPRANLVPFHAGKIIQTPQVLVFLSEDMSFRQVFTDGRSLPDDPNPSWMGYSVGQWDGDTLVVESIGYNDRTWLDFIGHPHTEALRMTERYQRPDFGHLSIEKTFTDQNAYSTPWTIKVTADFMPDSDLLEYICENERDSQHLIGTASDGLDVSKAVAIPMSTLQRFVGSYSYRLPENPVADRTVQVMLRGGQLAVDNVRELVPVSDTTFFVTTGQGVRVDFVSNPGEATRMIVHRAGGCGGSSGVAAGLFCGQAASDVTATQSGR